MINGVVRRRRLEESHEQANDKGREFHASTLAGSRDKFKNYFARWPRSL
jgi:hypothetical protein